MYGTCRMRFVPRVYLPTTEKFLFKIVNDKTLMPLQWCKEINQILKILVGVLIVDGVVPLD